MRALAAVSFGAHPDVERRKLQLSGTTADISTLARLIARTANADFKELSATSAGAADVRQVFEQAKNGLTLTGRFVAWQPSQS